MIGAQKQVFVQEARAPTSSTYLRFTLQTFNFFVFRMYPNQYGQRRTVEYCMMCKAYHAPSSHLIRTTTVPVYPFLSTK